MGKAEPAKKLIIPSASKKEREADVKEEGWDGARPKTNIQNRKCRDKKGL